MRSSREAFAARPAISEKTLAPSNYGWSTANRTRKANCCVIRTLGHNMCPTVVTRDGISGVGSPRRWRIENPEHHLRRADQFTSSLETRWPTPSPRLASITQERSTLATMENGQTGKSKT